MNLKVPQKVTNFINNLNEKGIPIPLLEDMLSQEPSLTYTLTLIAAVLMALAVCHVGSIDYDRAKEFLTLVGSGYLGRKGMKHLMPLPKNQPNQQTKEENKQ